MSYRHRLTEELLERISNSTLDEYGDIFHGSEYLARARDIGHMDSVLLLSMDGAQLYANKASDCWIYIWVILDQAPDIRYKKSFVFPGGFIPGPNPPQDTDSFLFPGLHHLSALQREGLNIWDASSNTTHLTRPFFMFGTADAVGLPGLNGLVGHRGQQGCRNFCNLKP